MRRAAGGGAFPFDASDNARDDDGDYDRDDDDFSSKQSDTRDAYGAFAFGDIDDLAAEEKAAAEDAAAQAEVARLEGDGGGGDGEGVVVPEVEGLSLRPEDTVVEFGISGYGLADNAGHCWPRHPTHCGPTSVAMVTSRLTGSGPCGKAGLPSGGGPQS
jgi:hypothetical protein